LKLLKKSFGLQREPTLSPDDGANGSGLDKAGGDGPWQGLPPLELK
jgi:hypothetical protein